MYPPVSQVPLGAASSAILAEALRRAAVRATWAPSVHNTQPWRFVLGRSGLAIHADYDRQLQVLDPERRQLIISCGCALFNARVSLAADGFTAEVRRSVPSRSRDLLAVVAAVPGGERTIAALDPVLELRRTNRRQFAEDQVPAELLATLQRVAVLEHASLSAITDEPHRGATALLSQRAEAEQQSDPAYRAELRAWVTDDQGRRDGIALATVPRGNGHQIAGSPAEEVPLRGYDDPGHPGSLEHVRSSRDQSLMVLGTDEDDPLSWLRAGEALERIWLEVTRAGYAMSLFTQLVEVAGTRELLRSELGLGMYPHVLLRVGRAPATPASRRRKLVEVLRQAPLADLR